MEGALLTLRRICPTVTCPPPRRHTAKKTESTRELGRLLRDLQRSLWAFDGFSWPLACLDLATYTAASRIVQSIE